MYEEEEKVGVYIEKSEFISNRWIGSRTDLEELERLAFAFGSFSTLILCL